MEKQIWGSLLRGAATWEGVEENTNTFHAEIAEWAQIRIGKLFKFFTTVISNRIYGMYTVKTRHRFYAVHANRQNKE